jgi:quinol monooxygenase YgiN
MSVTYVITFDIVPEQVDCFLRLLGEVLDAMRHESTFRDATLLRDPTCAHRFLLHETWDSHDDVVNIQIHRPYRAMYHAALGYILKSPRDITIWEAMRRDPVA